jgi:hypothetical protein
MHTPEAGKQAENTMREAPDSQIAVRMYGNRCFSVYCFSWQNFPVLYRMQGGHLHIMTVQDILEQPFIMEVVMKTSKIALSVLFCGVFLILSGCASKKTETQTQQPKELTGSRKPEVLQHKGSALGINELPVWVETYISQGITGLEKLPDYSGSYCFVGESQGTNLQAVQTWARNFEVTQTVGETIKSSINAKFVGSESGRSGNTYGSYFEGIVDKVSSASYSGVRRINDWWVLTRSWDANNRASDSYLVYVLYTTEKSLFDQQILKQVDDAIATTPATNEEKQSIANVRTILAKEGL